MSRNMILMQHSITIYCEAHLNHWMEVYTRQNYSFLKASMIVGLQLGYTVIFGAYASFLFIRTGHLLAPLVAHIFCNHMGLPVLFARRRGIQVKFHATNFKHTFRHSGGIVFLAFVAGMVTFLWLLFPVTQPGLYNHRTDNCNCWHGYCSWNWTL
ncbi:hypothetical protein Tsubulata_002420 [Turnera subulata]|uniref:intramembrane prenyl-peptidase Rce1 n=1 Tax=Turnera subulata TaxID=218843 RepID=A0A9Q0JCI7_9ROSI|nr:hypothetical protein Tsubulata_002420 [Turnera subulata]